MTSARRFWTVLGLIVASSIACAPFLVACFNQYITKVLRRDLAGAIEGKHSNDLRAIESAREAFAADNEGRYPQSIAELWKPGPDQRTDLGVPAPLLDAWRNEYHYQATECDPPTVRIWTLGRDGTLGGGGDDQDIGIWMFRQ